MAAPAIIAALIAKEGIKAAIKKFGKKAVKEATDTPKNKLAQKTSDNIKAKNKETRELYGLDDVPEATIQKNIATREAARKSMQKKVKSKKPLVVAGTAAAGLTGLIAESGRRRKEEAKKKEPEKKAMGGMMKKGYAKGGAVRKQSKPRGVGAAKRGFGKEMR